jgi:hypothetical protein
MGRDLDERQERITLALYGGVLAALAFFVVTFLFYLQVILPLLGQLGALQSDPSLAGSGAAISEPASDPAAGSTATIVVDSGTTTPSLITTTAEPATPRTQFFLLLAATLPGAVMVGWALCASWRRGIALAVAAHLILGAIGFIWVTPQTGGLEFVVPLYLLPVVFVPVLLLPQRIVPSFFLPLFLALIGLVALLQFGWWAVPLAWVVLPIAGAIAAARAANAAAA